jgi:hypothetical protein
LQATVAVSQSAKYRGAAADFARSARHLRKLESAGLVGVERAGREWLYRLNSRRLRVATEWLDWFGPPRAATKP